MVGPFAAWKHERWKVTEVSGRSEVAVAESARGIGVGRRLMEAVEEAALERGISLLWLTTHEGSEACAFYEEVGYERLGVMPAYSLRADGTLWPGAFYYKVLRRSP